ncbi:MAG: DUF2802 domain-containing protein [Pseudomonadales bacterium]|nr:DUF2802 domain-containing protein [Pseudomonadales bacterium]
MIDSILNFFHSSDLLLGLCFVLISMLMFQCSRLLKRIEELHENQVQSDVMQSNALKVVNQGAIGVGQRLLKIDKKLNVVLKQQSLLELRDPENLNYQHAISMMQTGLDAEKVMKTCGLAKGEVELIESLSKKQKQVKLREELHTFI